MHRILLGTTFAALSATAAAAGPYEAPPAPPPVYVEEPRCAQAFDCFYIGLEYGIAQGDGTREENLATANVPVVEFDLDGDAWGGFAGYNFQNGQMVFGGEARMLHFSDLEAGGLEFEDVIDLRARFGFAATESLLLYAAAGYSMSNAAQGGTDIDMDGFNFGGGVEFNVTERFFLGADVTARQLEGENGAFSYEADVNTATLRLGFRF